MSLQDCFFLITGRAQQCRQTLGLCPFSFMLRRKIIWCSWNSVLFYASFSLFLAALALNKLLPIKNNVVIYIFCTPHPHRICPAMYTWMLPWNHPCFSLPTRSDFVRWDSAIPSSFHLLSFPPAPINIPCCRKHLRHIPAPFALWT